MSTPLSEFSGTDRFLVVRRLGAGGMGVVYEAVDRERGARVALKTLRSLKPDALLRFKNEFRSLQDISHPNLVGLGELFEDAGQWFFTMDLVRGVHFLDYVRGTEGRSSSPAGPAADPDETPTVNLPNERGVYVAAPSPSPVRLSSGADETRLRAAFAELALGLAALHRAHKIHRDIKPANILVAPDGRVVILDFGLVTDALGSLRESHLVGTFSYMAPEQAGIRPVGPAADWYSVGVLLFQALAGRLPFKGTPQEILLLKQSFEAPAPSSIAPAGAVPEDLDRLCSELLRKDPAFRPSSLEVLRRFGVREAPYLADFVSPGSHFVGRAVELEALRAAFETTRGGCGVTMIVHGESGVGKTELVRHFTDSIARELRSAVIFAGRCHERESVPYKAVDGIIDALSRHLATLREDEVAELLPRQRGLVGQVFPVLRKVVAIAQAVRPVAGQLDALVLRARLFFALRDLFIKLAERRPLLLVIDDLQRADADSLALLAEIMRPPDGPRLLLVATMREESSLRDSHAGAGHGGREASGGAGAHSVDEIAQVFAGDVRRLNIRSLPADDARALVDALLREAGAGETLSAALVAEEAGGHPLFIDELVRRKLMLGVEAGPLRLDEALAARIDTLDTAARDLLAIVAVAGGPLVQEAAAAAANIPFHDFAREVARLSAQKLVRADGVRRTDTVEPYHDRVREAVLHHLDSEAQRGCHERLALALEALQKADPEALAVHWRGAGHAEKAASFALRAADLAADALAFDRAARFYGMALELRAYAGEEGRVLHQKLGDALANAGLGARAATAYLTAAGLAGPAEALELRRRAGEQLLRSGFVDQGIAELGAVLGAVGLTLPESPKRALASLLFRRAQVRLRGYDYRQRYASEIAPDELQRIDVCWGVASALGMVDTIRGADFQARGLILALSAGEPKRVARALAAEACYSATGGGPSLKRTEALLVAARDASKKSGDAYSDGWCALADALAAYLVGEWRRCYDACMLAEDTFQNRCTGAAWERATAELYAILSLFYLGSLREQSRRVDVGRREAEDRGDLFASTNVRTGYPVLAWLVRGDAEGARREVDEILSRWSRRGFFLAHYWSLLANAQIDLYEGHGDRAYARVTEQWPMLSKALLLEIQLIKLESLQVRARAALAAAVIPGENRERLLREAERDAKAIDDERMPWALPLAALIRAGIASARGQPAEAAVRLDEAAQGFQARGMALYGAVARMRLGEVLGGPAGFELVTAAGAWMSEQAVADPARIVAVFAPGFPSRPVYASPQPGAHETHERSPVR